MSNHCKPGEHQWRHDDKYDECVKCGAREYVKPKAGYYLSLTADEGEAFRILVNNIGPEDDAAQFARDCAKDAVKREHMHTASVYYSLAEKLEKLRQNFKKAKLN